MSYIGHEPIHRAPFKNFLNLCAGLDQDKTDSFWAARLKESLSIYPPMPAGVIARPPEQSERTITLDLTVKDIPESHIAWYAEAA